MKMNSLSELVKQLRQDLDNIRQYCNSKGTTISVAESVTAGCIQLILSTAEKAETFFQGGITAYNCSQKAIHLNVEPIFAESCHGVDQGITDTLAFEVCKLFRSQIGVAITGYATKVPEEGINRTFAFLSIAHNNEIIYRDEIENDCLGADAQWEFASTAIQTLSRELRKL